jgi:hypothetical protein
MSGMGAVSILLCVVVVNFGRLGQRQPGHGSVTYT